MAVSSSHSVSHIHSPSLLLSTIYSPNTRHLSSITKKEKKKKKKYMVAMVASPLSLLLILLSFSPLSHSAFTSFSKTPSKSNPVQQSSSTPLSPRAALLRYWSRKVPNNLPHPQFFTSKLSPLSPLDSTTFSTLSPTELSSKLPSFCSAAHLACSEEITSPSLAAHNGPSAFGTYSNSNFTNYATDGTGFTSSFANYSDGENVPVDTFRRYSRDAVGSDDSFTAYSPNGNVVTTNFTSYSTSATGGVGRFTAYQANSNVPDLKFTNYDTDANGPDRTFSAYTDSTNAGDETFAGYGKRGNGVPTKFSSYSNNSNVINSRFSGYGEDANGAFDNFTSYGENGNVPELGFKSYGENGNGGVDVFKTYRNQSNVGDDNFTSYGKGNNNEQASFANYGESFNEGSDNFKGYGEGSTDDEFNFTSYSGDLTNFKAYYNLKKGNEFTFKSYVNASTVPHSDDVKVVNSAEEEMKVKMMMKKMSGSPVNRWVEPGKFFRERNLKTGNVMPMPDIRDKMPSRSFLPRSIASKIPFSAGEVRKTFNILEDSAMGKAVGDTIAECQRAPSRGETKRCATSAEDMIDFAVSVLGSNVVVRSTENTRGSKGDIMIGDVKGVNGGKVTQSVSCHQSLFPYLVYYCHSVPKVRVYEADILAVDSKEKINHGVAICHIDTSDWSAGHGAFVALGSAPGKIEVCHWIFEGDMTWATAD